ncbi:hypothetical protein OEZ86_008328 [Tetradesmus obliquus]|nr:hypothetical protein OEZ86_008328 [Tetradesmus obliquus]
MITYMGRVQGARQKEGRSEPRPVEEWDQGLLDGLRDDFRSYMRLDLADSTGRSYGSQERQYRKFCVRIGKPEVPDAEVLARFVVGRALNDYKLSTIEVGVAAISRWAADEGLFDAEQQSLASHKLVRRAMRIAAKHAVASVNQKRPLSRADLRVLVKHLRSRRDFIGDRDAAMFLVGWAGMFRSAELVGVEWRDLQVYEEGGEAEKGVAIYVPYSKTDQAGEGAWVFVAACEAEKEMCPLRALQRLRKWGGADGKDLRDAGVAEAEQYAAHSLRRGGATHAARQKIALRKIQMMGRWKSDVVRLYLYAAPVELMQAAAQMQRKQP